MKLKKCTKFKLTHVYKCVSNQYITRGLAQGQYIAALAVESEFMRHDSNKIRNFCTKFVILNDFKYTPSSTERLGPGDFLEVEDLSELPVELHNSYIKTLGCTPLGDTK